MLRREKLSVGRTSVIKEQHHCVIFKTDVQANVFLGRRPSVQLKTDGRGRPASRILVKHHTPANGSVSHLCRKDFLMKTRGKETDLWGDFRVFPIEGHIYKVWARKLPIKTHRHNNVVHWSTPKPEKEEKKEIFGQNPTCNGRRLKSFLRGQFDQAWEAGRQTSTYLYLQKLRLTINLNELKRYRRWSNLRPAMAAGLPGITRQTNIPCGTAQLYICSIQF